MKGSSLILVDILVFISVILGTIECRPKTNGSEANENPRLVNLGTVDGKSYFVDKAMGNWTLAKTYCQGFGMKQATITTANQATFLASKYETGVFEGWHWIGARDAQLPRAFSWDESNSEPMNLAGLTWRNHLPTFFTCAAYYIMNSTKEIRMYPCSYSNGYTLCET